MPTSIFLVSSSVNIGQVPDVAALTPSLDFIIVAAFSVVGLLLTLGFAWLFPLSANMAALISSVT